MAKRIQHIISKLSGINLPAIKSYGGLEKFLQAIMGTMLLFIAVATTLSVSCGTYLLFGINLYGALGLGGAAGILVVFINHTWISWFKKAPAYYLFPFSRYVLLFFKFISAILLCHYLTLPLDIVIYEGEITAQIKRENSIVQKLNEQNGHTHIASIELIELHNSIELSEGLSKHIKIRDYLNKEHPIISHFLLLVKLLLFLIYLIPAIILLLHPFQNEGQVTLHRKLGGPDLLNGEIEDSPKLSDKDPFVPIGKLLDYATGKLDSRYANELEAYLAQNDPEGQVVKGIHLFFQSEDIEREELKAHLDNKWEEELRKYLPK